MQSSPSLISSVELAGDVCDTPTAQLAAKANWCGLCLQKPESTGGEVRGAGGGCFAFLKSGFNDYQGHPGGFCAHTGPCHFSQWVFLALGLHRRRDVNGLNWSFIHHKKCGPRIG